MLYSILFPNSYVCVHCLCFLLHWKLLSFLVCVYILGKLFLILLILMCCMFQSEALLCVFYMYSAHDSVFSCSDYSKCCSTLTPDMCYHISVHINKLKHSNRDFDLTGRIHSHKWDATHT